MISDQILAWAQPTLTVAGTILIFQVLAHRARMIEVALLLGGFFMGLWEILLAIVAGAKGLLGLPTLVLLAVSGMALLSRPTRNIHWAALLGFGAGLASTCYFNMILGHTVPIALALVFLASSLLVYLLFKFAEDLIAAIGTILEVRVVSFIIGIVCIVSSLKFI
jgi:hypothetical protein